MRNLKIKEIPGLRNLCRRIQGLLPILLALILLAGCVPEPLRESSTEAVTDDSPEGSTAPSTNFYTEGQTMEVDGFIFDHNGMSLDQCFSYSAVREEVGTKVTCELFARNTGFCTTSFYADASVMEELGRIAGKYGLDRWDGFDDVNNDILDGSGFSLSMTLSDGKRVLAYGSNSFPTGYGEAAREICILFEQLIFELGDVYPKTLTSDDLTGVDIRFSTSENTFSFAARKNEEGSVELNITANGYEAYFPDGNYRFLGSCQQFSFDEVQAVVRKYDLPTWNGWGKYWEQGSDLGWFSITLDYESEESIFAEGSLFPEHYAEVREELLEVLCRFIQENEGTFLTAPAE